MSISEEKQVCGGPKVHPERRDLEAFMRAELPRNEAPCVVRHLLTNCAECLEVTRRLWRPERSEVVLRAVAEEETRQARRAAIRSRRLLKFNGR
jgi:hypothetical protein